MNMQAGVPASARKRNSRASKTRNARSRSQFVTLISAKWQEQVSSIIEVGTLLETAKLELAHGEYEAMIKEDLPFGPQTARKLKTVAAHEQLRAHVRDLPASWGTLYELTKLSAEQFESAIESGAINPKMERKHAVALRASTKKSEPQQQHAYDSRVANCLLSVREKIDAVLPLIADVRPQFFDALRKLVAQIENETEPHP